MKVRHLFPSSDPMLALHVELLCKWTHTEDAELPDIVHVHGCWNHDVAVQATRLLRRGARLVLSPHAGLQPWMLPQRGINRRLGKTLLWQRRLVGHAYALIAHGETEATALRQLGWNPRVETIRNAVVTQTITPEKMGTLTQRVYQKVMDSHTLALMTDDDRKALATIIKAGITGDSRWCGATPAVQDWRLLLLHAEHEGIRHTVDRGISVLGLTAPTLDTASTDCYLPQSYIKLQATGRDVLELTQLMHKSQPTWLGLVTLDEALRRPDVDDERLMQSLRDKHLDACFARLLALLSEETLLDEGFMPCEPVDDRQTRNMRNQLANHLRI